MPVGTPTIKVAAVKKALVPVSIPAVYIWCAQTIEPMNAIEPMANTMPIGPKIDFVDACCNT
jgi:hypothetical protein